jgi:hypothetical protein
LESIGLGTFLRMTRQSSALVAVLLTFLLAACGEKDDDSGSSGGDAELEQAIDGVYSNNGLTGQEITDDTIRIELDQGTKDDPIACTTATSLGTERIDGRIVVLVFPDGELTCSDL